MEIEIKNLIQNKIIKIGIDKIVIDIDEIISYNLEIYEKIVEDLKKFIDLVKEEVKLYSITNVPIKIINWKEKIDISKIRVKDINKTFKIDGMVCKLTEPMALVIERHLICLSCGSTIKTKGKEKFRCSCGGIRYKEEKVELQNIQELVIEELQERTEGKQPRKIRIRLTDKLTGKSYADILKPGNRISVIGVIDKIKLPNKTESEEIYSYRVFALDISSLDEKFDDNISEEDLEKIKHISSNKPLDLLSNSLAPSIIGLSDLKKLLILQMVGGVKKESFYGKSLRHWINVLIVGEPGVAKSYLATNVLMRTPKSFYATGDNASDVGLTAGTVRDEILGSWSVEAGVLVKANGSIAIIDELDKFKKEQLKALHTPMELGFVKVSKIVDAIFPSETSVLGLANPKFGTFEDNKSLVEQINLPPALLSRFDIICILKDEVNKELDDKIVESIYSKSDKKIEFIDIPLFRKYIVYAKKLNPELPKEHLKDLQSFYHDVRKKSSSRESNMKGMPIGVRHLQGVIRLAEASAKIRLSDKVEKEDIDFAKDLFYKSLIKIGMDEGGLIDMARMSSSKTISKRKYMETLIEIIRSVNSENLTEIELKQVVEEKGFPMNKYYDTISELNREGFIIKSNGQWKII